MAVSATTLRVQEFDKGRGPVGLPPIGQACDLPTWPDQGPREGSLVKFWSGHQPDADAHRERRHPAQRAWWVTTPRKTAAAKPLPSPKLLTPRTKRNRYGRLPIRSPWPLRR